MSLVRLACFLILQCIAIVTYANNIAANEAQLKAAYLYKFATYIDWPAAAFAQADSPFVIGVIDADDIAQQLALLGDGLQVNNHIVVIKNLKAGDSLDGLQVLFLGHTNHQQLQSQTKTIQSKPILTVTATPGALGVGSIINFVPVGNHLRFEISLVTAEQRNLKISARLLGVAHKIESGE